MLSHESYPSGEWHEMVLAQGENFNVLDNDELVMIFVEYSAVDDVAKILLIAFREEHHGFCISLWCVMQAFPIWIFSYTFEQCPDRTL